MCCGDARLARLEYGGEGSTLRCVSFFPRACPSSASVFFQISSVCTQTSLEIFGGWVVVMPGSPNLDNMQSSTLGGDRASVRVGL